MLQIRKLNKSGRPWLHSLKYNSHRSHSYLMHTDHMIMNKKKQGLKSQILRWTKDSKIDKRSKKPLSSYLNYNTCKYCLLFLVVICIGIILLIYVLSTPSIPLKQQMKSTYCNSSLSTQNNHRIINTICSLTNYLNINTFTNRDCYMQRPAEGHWAIGWILTLWYSTVYGTHCETVNINEHLTENSKDSDNKFTILINTWQRNECLINSVEHYLKCSDVAQIRVIWSDPKNNIPNYLQNIKHKLSMNGNSNKLIFDEYKDNKLTNRFKYNTEWITDGIFQTDDDIKYSCQLLSNAFKLWKLFPDYMVGFASREPTHEYKSKNKNDINMKYQFYQWDMAGIECKYSMMFVTLGGFMHKKYYKLYTENDINGWEEIKKYVNGNITAEDISMSLLYSYHTGYPPINVVVPKPDMLIDDFLYCQGDKSAIMHTNSRSKRTKIYFDILNTFGYFDNKFDLITSSLWVDVMPLSNHKCWLE